MRVLIGSTNPGKAAELARAVEARGCEAVFAADLELGAVEENGATFEENALLKARTYAARSGLPTVADDSGLEIDALNGAPGVYSRRWAGEDATDLKLAVTVMDRLSGLVRSKRTARLKCVVALALPDGRAEIATEAIEGHIAEELDASKIAPGLPYRALFVVDACGKLYADLTHEEHEAVNHRRKAVARATSRLHALVFS